MYKPTFFITVILLAIMVSCEDDLPVTEAPPTPTSITVDSPWQYSIKIDGTTFTAKEGLQNYIGNYSTSGFIAPFPDTSALIYLSGLSNDTVNTNSLNIIKGTLRFASGMIPDTISYRNFFTPATYPYSVAANNGIVIEWYDSNGDLWSTDSGTANQSGSTFVITNIKTSFVNAYFDVRLKATFNCKLYNSTGQSKTLIEGVYVGSFEAI